MQLVLGSIKGRGGLGGYLRNWANKNKVNTKWLKYRNHNAVMYEQIYDEEYVPQALLTTVFISIENILRVGNQLHMNY